MAALKFTFLFCAIFMVVQAHALPHNQLKADGDITDLIKTIVRAVSESLDRIITDAENLINKVTEDSWSSVQQKSVEVANHVAGAVVDVILKELSLISDESTDAGKKLSACVQSARDSIVAVPVTFWDDASKCTGGDLVKTIQALGPIVKDLGGVHEDAKKIAAKVDDCQGNDIPGLLCLVNVAGELIDVLKTIPEVVSGDVGQLVEDGKALIATVQNCVTAEVPVYFTNSGKVLGDIAACAAA